MNEKATQSASARIENMICDAVAKSGAKPEQIRKIIMGAMSDSFSKTKKITVTTLWKGVV